MPADTPGAAVVTVGFPINAALSLLFAAGLIACVSRRWRLAPHVLVGAATLEIGSLAILVATRAGSVFGWAEPAWTAGAKQSLAVEIAAILSLTVVGAIAAWQRRHTSRLAVAYPDLDVNRRDLRLP